VENEVNRMAKLIALVLRFFFVFLFVAAFFRLIQNI